MKFSERKGYKPINKFIQTEGMNDELRTTLWNILFLTHWNIASARNGMEESQIYGDLERFSTSFLVSYLKKPIDTRPYDFTERLGVIRTYFMQCKWYEVYDFIEFALNIYTDQGLMKLVN